MEGAQRVSQSTMSTSKTQAQLVALEGQRVESTETSSRSRPKLTSLILYLRSHFSRGELRLPLLPMLLTDYLETRGDPILLVVARAMTTSSDSTEAVPNSWSITPNFLLLLVAVGRRSRSSLPIRVPEMIQTVSGHCSSCCCSSTGVSAATSTEIAHCSCASLSCLVLQRARHSSLSTSDQDRCPSPCPFPCSQPQEQ